MLIYGIIFASLLLNAEWSIAQSSLQKESHADEALPVLEVTATRSKKGITNIPAALSKTSSREIRFGLPLLLSMGGRPRGTDKGAGRIKSERS
ncbi:MAG TPA: hypothetical protein EYN05_05030 [Nitrospinaceae bacterium]|nr:hypothetical protein [Nitrospinaceae bacterium]